MAKRHRHIFLTFIAVAFCIAPAWAQLTEPKAVADAVDVQRRIDEAWNRWDTQALQSIAREAIDPMAKQLAQAAAQFMAGEYDRALALAGGLEDADEWIARRTRTLEDTATSWRSVLNNKVLAPSVHSGLELYCPSDHLEWMGAILPRIETMAQRYDEALGEKPERVLRIVWVSSYSELAAVSQVPLEKVEASGTAAVTLFGVIYLLSPSVFDHGYLWQRVLGHEMVHWHVHPQFSGSLPTFLEEGLAKWLEDLGRTGEYRTLDPMEQTLLQLAHEKDLLASEEALSKPFWHFRSGLTARVAFLQAMLLVREWLKQIENNPIRTFVQAMGTAQCWQETLESQAGWSTRRFFARGRGRWRSESSREHLAEFIHDSAREYLSARQARQIEDGKQTVLLGDLLWGQGERQAALRVYFRLPDLLQENPDVAWRIAMLLLELDRTREAGERLQLPLSLHPHDARLLHVAAMHARQAGDDVRAKELAIASWLIYPFSQENLALLNALKGPDTPGHGDTDGPKDSDGTTSGDR